VTVVDFQAFDAAYLQKLLDRDEPTESHFVMYFSELLSLKLRSRLSTPQAIEDVKQETFARTLALLRKGGVREASRLGPLVNSICNHVLAEGYRSSRRVEPLEELAAERLVEPAPDALEQSISADTCAMVREVVEGLDERDRKLLRFVFLEERDKEEVCTQMGVDRDYLRVLLHRAKTAFRKVYARQAGPLRRSAPSGSLGPIPMKAPRRDRAG
jgi:RNA polymerase sigma-70 factor (ECF subfamily)